MMKSFLAIEKTSALLRLIVCLTILSRFFMIGEYIFLAYFFPSEVYWITDSNEFLTICSSGWDNKFYLSIIQLGYMQDPVMTLWGGGGERSIANWGFFPCYPLLLSALHQLLFAIPIGVECFFVSACFTVGIGYLGANYLMQTRHNKVEAILFVVFLCFGPGNVYYTCYYTEVLYGFLLLAILLALRQEKFLLAGCIGAFLSATRLTGILVMVPFCMKGIMLYRGHWRSLCRDAGFVLGCMLIPLGLALFAHFLYTLQGDALAFSHIQAAVWGCKPRNPFIVLYEAMISDNSVLQRQACWAFLGMACLLLSLKNRHYYEAVLGAFFLFVPLSATVNSLPRYMIGSLLFTFSILDAVYAIVHPRRHRIWAYWAFLVAILVGGFGAYFSLLQGYEMWI